MLVCKPNEIKRTAGISGKWLGRGSLGNWLITLLINKTAPQLTWCRSLYLHHPAPVLWSMSFSRSGVSSKSQQETSWCNFIKVMMSNTHQLYGWVWECFHAFWSSQGLHTMFPRFWFLSLTWRGGMVSFYVPLWATATEEKKSAHSNILKPVLLCELTNWVCLLETQFGYFSTTRSCGRSEGFHRPRSFIDKHVHWVFQTSTEGQKAQVACLFHAFSEPVVIQPVWFCFSDRFVCNV